MLRYWKIYKTFFTSSLVRELEFKANFIAKILQNLTWIFFFLLILLVVYGNTRSVAGWSRGDAFILAATVFEMNAIYAALFISLQDIPQQVRLGTLDFVITKPVDTQFWVSTRRFNFDQIGSLIAGFVMVAVGIATSGLHPSPAQWLAYILLTLASITIFYAFNLALMTTGIWLVRVDNLSVLSETVTIVARYPLDIYGTGLQRAFTYFVPLAFIATIPSRQLVLAADWPMVLLGVVYAFLALALARLFWRYAMTKYTSASS